MILLDALIAAAILAVALAVVGARSVVTATVFFVAYGLLLALAWARLDAVDVAMTEAAIGAGLSGVLLLGAARRAAPPPEAPPGRATLVLTGLGCAAVSIALGAAILALPDPATGLAAPVMANIAAIEVANPVTAVLMGFRALDTLLEAAVLVLAVVALWALTPDGAWGGAAGWRPSPLQAGPLALLARVMPPLGVVVAVHILWVGADAPGGKFQAAAILAAMWLLPWIAGLAPAPPVSARWLRLLVAAGPAAFILAGAWGAATQGAFLAGLGKPAILALEVVLTASIAAALALLVLGPPEAPAPGPMTTPKAPRA